MRGSLWRVANEQLRSATHEESLGAEIVNRYLKNLSTELQTNRGARRYVDVTREGQPRFPGEPRIVEEDGEEIDDAEDDVMSDLEREEDEPSGADDNQRLRDRQQATAPPIPPVPQTTQLTNHSTTTDNHSNETKLTSLPNDLPFSIGSCTV